MPSGRPESEELPLVILIHGRGADAFDLAEVAPALDGPGGYRFVFPNAPKPFEAYPGMTFGFTWFDGWPPSPESVGESRRLLLQFLEQVTRRYPTPEGKVILSGFSQGALMALDAGLRTGMRLAGVVAMSGGIYEEQLPDLSSKKELPILIVHGTADDVIPLPAARRARQVLERHGLRPEYREFPMGHHVTAESMACVADFIRRCLG
ncbi:MAG TPA: alpha/beta hydrolase [Thermoanaerobaculia bacterium]|nr:alpha/beta hydrolase [Thermoanaerobaculia bacterium]